MEHSAEIFDNKAHKQREREIGCILTEARQRERRTVTECAAAMQTTRRRYSLIERGDASITAAELEAMMRFLRISPELIWQEFWFSSTQLVVVKAQIGELVRLIVEVN